MVVIRCLAISSPSRDHQRIHPKGLAFVDGEDLKINQSLFILERSTVVFYKLNFLALQKIIRRPSSLEPMTAPDVNMKGMGRFSW